MRGFYVKVHHRIFFCRYFIPTSPQGVPTTEKPGRALECREESYPALIGSAFYFYLADMNAPVRISKEIWGHLLFWALYLFIRLFVIQLYPGSFLFRLTAELVELPLKAAALYVAIYGLIRPMIHARNYGLFMVRLIGYVIVVMFLNRVEDYFILYPLTGSDVLRYDAGFWNLYAAFVNLIYVYPVVGLGAAIYFIKQWYDDQLKHERLLREKTDAEMKLLKDQLHPHFLFNTLNNIYSLAQVKHDHVPDMIWRLSQLLSFMLYDSSMPVISLRKEVQALQDYIELERLRLGKRLEISFETDGDIDRFSLSPLLLFPFVENCFKHGSHQTPAVVWIRIHISVQQNTMVFRAENSLPENVTPSDSQHRGIGLMNIQRRLDVLYPGRYELYTHQSDTFLVRLTLQGI
jgi:two-component system LytT family sensor kinase